jgi:hypothetical protein
MWFSVLLASHILICTLWTGWKTHFRCECLIMGADTNVITRNSGSCSDILVEPLASIFRQLTPKKQTPWPECANELYRPSDRRLSAALVPTFADRRCNVVSVTDPYGRILRFLDRSHYFFFEVAPQLYSRGWVNSVPDPLPLRKSGSAEKRTRTSGSVARNSDH